VRELGGSSEKGYHNIMQNFSSARFFSTKFPYFPGLRLIIAHLSNVFLVINVIMARNVLHSFSITPI